MKNIKYITTQDIESLAVIPPYIIPQGTESHEVLISNDAKETIIIFDTEVGKIEYQLNEETKHLFELLEIKKEGQLWQVLEHEIKLALISYEEMYNKENKRGKVDIQLKMYSGLKATPDEQEQGYTKRSSLQLILKIGGVAHLLCSRTYGFRNDDEFADEGQWKLVLYRDMLYQIAGVCIGYNQLKLDPPKEVKTASGIILPNN